MIDGPMDVWGAPLEVEVLLFDCLLSFLLKHDWLTSKTMQGLRRRPTEPYGDQQHENEFNVQPQVVPPGFRTGSKTAAAI